MKDTIAAYDALVARAIAIVDKAPFWRYVGEPSFARLTVDGDTATLMWPEAETYYDSTTIQACHVSFASALLTLSGREFDEWKAEEMRLHQRKERERKAQEIAEREQSERAALAALKAKYESA
jgi:hypothetical protein